MIEYARIMTATELGNFFQSISRNYNHKKSLAWEYLIQQKDKLISDYYKFEEQQVNMYYEDKKRLLNEKASWNNKICGGCGQKMIIVNSEFSSFWGCCNFRNNAFKHITFPLKYEEYFPERWQNLRVKINSNWATDIIRQNDLQLHVKASNLLDFYDELGLEDLREKYGYKNSKDGISGYIKAKIASSFEEKEITKHLSSIFPKSNEQMAIRYKLQDANEKVAIVDLILSDLKEVNIVEIKRSVLDLKAEQLQLYHSLISFILKMNNDIRICKSIFIVYNCDEPYYKPECKYLLYEKIRSSNNQSIIQRYFDEFKAL